MAGRLALLLPFNSSNAVFSIPFLVLACTTLASSALVCPKCGNLSVPYPLSTSSSCGHPLYPMICNRQERLQVMALSGNYTVLSVHPLTQTFMLAPAEFIGNSCITTDSVTSGGFSLDKTGPYYLTPQNIILLFNVSEALLITPLVHCGNSGPCSQALTVFRQQSCKSLPCCSIDVSDNDLFNYTFPVKGVDTAYSSVVNWINGTSPTTWNYGLQLGWITPTEPPCKTQSDCGRDSTCSSMGVRTSKACFCNHGFLWDAPSGFCLKAPHCVWRIGSMKCEKLEYALGLTVASVGLLALSAVTVVVFRRRRTAPQRERAKSARDRFLNLAAKCGGKPPRLFSNSDMKRATNGFARDRVLGSGGFGEVFKGVLDNGTVVAIKTAKIGNWSIMKQGVEQMLNEVIVLSQVNHRNLVRLLGCCVESELPLIVYEYVPHGNLLDHLSGRHGSFLDWKTRLQIALQSAAGLAYLHSSAYPPIYHRDVKSSNILLDEYLNARVADFGLSRLVDPDATHVWTCGQGTLGYLDPEYYRSCQLTDKSDVYSFGVVLLELVTSQKAIDMNREEDEASLAMLVQKRAEEGNTGDVLDVKLVVTETGEVCLESMRSVLTLALECVQERGVDRPTMKEVAEELHLLQERLTGHE